MSGPMACPAIRFVSFVPSFAFILRVSTGHGFIYDESKARWLPSHSFASRWRAPLGLYDPIIKSVAALSVAANRALKVASPVMFLQSKFCNDISAALIAALASCLSLRVS